TTQIKRYLAVEDDVGTPERHTFELAFPLRPLSKPFDRRWQIAVHLILLRPWSNDDCARRERLLACRVLRMEVCVRQIEHRTLRQFFDLSHHHGAHLRAKTGIHDEGTARSRHDTDVRKADDGEGMLRDSRHRVFGDALWRRLRSPLGIPGGPEEDNQRN